MALSIRKKLVQAVNELPSEALPELSNFIDYLRYKLESHAGKKEQTSGSDFLRSIAGIGHSAEDDLSERDETVLAEEIDPVHGWHLGDKTPK